MATSKTKRKRPSLQSIYVHHIIWAAICLILLIFIMSLWFGTRTLDQKTAALEQRIATLSRLTEPVCSARAPWTANTTKRLSVETDGEVRSFLVHLPKDFNPAQSYPAVLFFPGKGSSAVAGEQNANLNSFPAVTIYPEPTVGRDQMYSWQGAPYSSGADDVQFVSNILDKVEAQLCIQRARVYAAGLSNGGGMVSLLSCKLSDRFAAYGIVAGAMYYPDGGCTPPTPTPLISIHGDGDITVPYFGSAVRRLPAIDDWVSRRAIDNGCAPTPDITTSLSVTTTTWMQCSRGSTVKNIRIHNAGHLWGSDAPATLWQFFSAHTL